jgi:hypothetical protein
MKESFAAVEKENLELYNQFVTESYEIAYMIRVKEMEIIKRSDPSSLLLTPRPSDLTPLNNESSSGEENGSHLY